MIQLGPDFRFTTTLESRAQVDNGVLNGELIARFGGDATLQRQDIRNMVAEFKKAGAQQIKGNVLLDMSVFASYDKVPGWPWNDMTQCFSAPLLLLQSWNVTVTVSQFPCIAPLKLTIWPTFISPLTIPPVVMLSQVRTLDKGSPDVQYCELDVVPGDLNRYTLTRLAP